MAVDFFQFLNPEAEQKSFNENQKWYDKLSKKDEFWTKINFDLGEISERKLKEFELPFMMDSTQYSNTYRTMNEIIKPAFKDYLGLSKEGLRIYLVVKERITFSNDETKIGYKSVEHKESYFSTMNNALSKGEFVNFHTKYKLENQGHFWDGILIPFSYNGSIFSSVSIVLNDNEIVPEIKESFYFDCRFIQSKLQDNHRFSVYLDSILNGLSEPALVLNEFGAIIAANDLCLKLINLAQNSADNLNSTLKEYIQARFPKLDTGDNFIIMTNSGSFICSIKKRMPISSYRDNSHTLIVLNANRESNSIYSTQKSKSSIKNRNPIEFFDRIIGATPEIIEIKKTCMRIADSSVSILIEGETGTGKELIAEALHQASGRKGPFIAINCGALPRELLNSELFGYDSGSFTGGLKEGKAGKMELADGGTVFLDEIGEMPLDLQVALLRFLQDKTVSRIGSSKSKKVDVRIISATNRCLQEEVNKRTFREDLFYRLNVINIRVPSLKERRNDIPIIIDHFIKQLCEAHGFPSTTIDQSAMQALMSYGWPGNVRELHNIIERILILNGHDIITFDDLPADYKINKLTIGVNDAIKKENNSYVLKNMEKELVAAALKKHDWNITKAAYELGINRSTLYSKMQIYQFTRPR
ncbi:sigma 54-interacting transcriptional regulator [Dehalobacter sp. DCM]|uniref:sigma-54 interaction domain-containing protein n=1 Tax=Dehalobacter sp. DCM TaxID=2907827 RepID=UPI003081481D|nr:sigma 54-interacting transcriptional regulator [Dehalobacter sp. DCM]